MCCRSFKIYFSSAVVLITAHASAQIDSSKVQHAASIRDLYIQNGFFFQSFSNGTLQDFKVMAPQSTLLQNNFYSFTNSGKFNVNAGALECGSVGINFPNKLKNYYRPDPQLRIGITGSSGTYLSCYYSKETIIPFDTIPSGVPGSPFVIDSIYKYEYKMDYISDQVRLDAALIFRTNRMKRWTYYAGAGASFGVAINSHTDITYTYSTKVKTEKNYAVSGSPISSARKDSVTSESFQNRNSVAYAIYIPLGIDFRLGKRREFWKHIHFFWEVRFGINATNIPELRLISNGGMVNSTGLRISIN